ncbi:Stk1 family PASTA domain-containing Ser/Thr kinase [soil metagenome]
MTTTDGQYRRIANRYVLRGLLGQGGMADVELAYDDTLDRQVAVKMLHERYASDDSFIDRFKREAQSAAALNHPNVVGVYDTGNDDGRPYIVMEYIAGRTLKEIMKREGVLPRRAAEIGAEAARALHFAHERGIVHRDIKPGNIMISDDGRVKVTDFGIARAVNVESVTQTSSVFGTAAYVAPEQAQGQRVDGRTDIYALGCVLFEMLTGQQPFDGETAVTLAYKHVSEAPPAPRSINPEIPESMEAVVLKAMAKDPAERYQTGKELAEDLQRAGDGQRVLAATGTAFAITQAIPHQSSGPAAQPDPTLMDAPPPRRPVPRLSDEYYEPSGPNLGRIAAYAFLALLIAALVGIAAYLFSGLADDGDQPIEQVVIPAIVGLNNDEAQQQLVDLGLQPDIGGQEADPEAPPNAVLRTDPDVGTTVDRGSTVTLFLSSGPGNVVIPDVAGMTESEAERTLATAGLGILEVVDEPDDEIEEGLAIRTQPVAGINAVEGDEVTLIVSGGEQTFVMPFVVDQTVETAREQIETACDDPAVGVCALVEVEVDPVEGDGRVLRTDPASGEEVLVGSTVTITASRQEVTETPTPVPTATPTPEPTPTPTPEPTPTPTPAPVPTATQPIPPPPEPPAPPAPATPTPIPTPTPTAVSPPTPPEPA